MVENHKEEWTEKKLATMSCIANLQQICQPWSLIALFSLRDFSEM